MSKKRWARWVISNGCFGYLVYLGVTGHGWAANALLFLSALYWSLAVLSLGVIAFIALVSKADEAALEALPPRKEDHIHGVALVLDIVFDTLVVAIMATSGWTLAALFYLFHSLLLHAAIRIDKGLRQRKWELIQQSLQVG